ncbi:unnamed protein product [Angiostrongylus costaricensis]|uniref:TOG domain-containing protein n=1 Tax=Angiostrongylus costaricensis TaxID=334426 RepID=A0A158PFX0_ANGCS|nr:unnamed protein product [Angiostrongylus costaricensis]
MFRVPLLPGDNGEADQENQVRHSVLSRGSSMPAQKRVPPSVKNAVNSTGAVNEEDFRKAFTQVPKCGIYSSKELLSQMESIRKILENVQGDWSQRVNSLKLLRSILINGGMDYESELLSSINSLEDALLTSVKDLRSQVCREACITVSFLCEKLGVSVVRLCEALLPATIGLIPNSAKIMSTSGITASHFIVKAGIGDADAQARASARNSYQHLDQHYPHLAQLLFQSLDHSRQRSLSGAISAASSSQSVNSERDSLNMAHRPGAFGLNRPRTTNFFAGRSASEIDANAVRRAAAFSPTKSKLAGSAAVRNTPARPNVVRTGVPPRQKPLKSSNSANPPGSVSQLTTPNHGAGSNGHAAVSDTRQLCSAIKNFSLNADDSDFPAGVIRYDQAELTDALAACLSVNLNERKGGLRSLLEILKVRRNLQQLEIKKVCDVLSKLLTEGNHKLMQILMDILNVFVSSYHDNLGDWLQFLLLKLLYKSGVEILPTLVQPLNMALRAVRTTFRPELQLIALCKNIQDPIQTPPLKVKAATLNYLHELLQGMEQGSSLARDEIRAAVQKIFYWMEDPKKAAIKVACERVIYDFFSLNTADFSTILSDYPPQWREFAYSLLKKNKPSDSTLQRSPALVATPPREAVADQSSQVTDFIDGRGGLTGPLMTSISLSDSPNSSSHFLNGRLSKGSSATNDGDLSLSNINEERDFYEGKDEFEHKLESTMYLKDDAQLQNEYIASLLKELSTLDPSRRNEQNHALQILQQMVSEGSLTTWEENFKSLILHIFNVLTENDVTLKRNALKLLTKICVAQAMSFYDLAEMTLFKVLDSISEEENQHVMNVADECLKTLATHFPLHVVIRATKPIIAQENDPRVGPALKMLTRLIESLDAEELTARLPEIAPGVVNCYSNPQSSVRKSTVFCLVAMVNKVGREPLNPYLEPLPSCKIHLLEVYIQRTQTSSTHF